MQNRLPDEMLSEIFSLVLEVSDEKFSDTSSRSPFATYSVPSSSVLLVNRRWLGIATPLLYKCVVVRTAPQAAGLAHALYPNDNDLYLGRHVKKMRIEGNFGQDLHLIMDRTPNVTDLFISAVVFADEQPSGVVGFTRGLQLLNPTRLILYDPDRPRNNKVARNLIDGVTQAMSEKWTNLTTICLSSYHALTLPSRKKLREAICSSTSLKIISISASREPGFTSFLNALAAVPSIELIEIKYHEYTPKKGVIDDSVAQPLLISKMRRSDTRKLVELVTRGAQSARLWRWIDFEAWSRTNAGHTAVELTNLIIEPLQAHIKHSPTIFLPFTRLRSLAWQSTAIFSMDPRHLFVLALPALERLEVISPGILTVLSEMELPSLRFLVLRSYDKIYEWNCASFLAKHGHKITDIQLDQIATDGLNLFLVFQLCTALLTLRLVNRKETKPLTALNYPDKHRSLAKLVLVESLFGVALFSKTDWSDFPALREIQVMDLYWPVSERKVGESPWVTYAEKLLGVNIKLLSREGVPWIMRLKPLVKAGQRRKRVELTDIRD